MTNPLIDPEALSKPAVKLIGEVSNAISAVYEPTRIRRKAKADADALAIKAEGEEELKDIAWRASERVRQREIQRQINIESIITSAISFLPPSVSKDKVDPYLLLRLFDNCQDIEDEGMRSIWAKLLAGEFVNPGTYSIRTLENVKSISHHEAISFTKFCGYAWKIDHLNMHLCLYSDEVREYINGKDIYMAALVKLESAGLLRLNYGVQLKTLLPETVVSYFGKQFKIKQTVESRNDAVPLVVLTTAGNELAAICGAKDDQEYIQIVLKSVTERYKIQMEEI